MMADKHGAVRAALCEYLEKTRKPAVLHTEYKFGDWPADVFVKMEPKLGEPYEEIIEVETGYSRLLINEEGETQLERKLRLAKSGGVRLVSFCLPYRWRNEALEEIAEKGMEICSVYFFDEDEDNGITIEGFEKLPFSHSKPHQNPLGSHSGLQVSDGCRQQLIPAPSCCLEGFDGHTRWGYSKPSIVGAFPAKGLKRKISPKSGKNYLSE